MRGLVVATLGVGILHALTLRPEDLWHGDVVQMLAHAQNLVAGRPYADTGYIQNPLRFYSPTAYPPGYPLVLAPFVALFGASSLVVKGVATGLLTAAVGALALLFRRGLPAFYAYAFVASAGLQPYLWEAKHYGFSGFVVLCFAALSLVLYETRGERGGGALRFVGAGGLAGLAASAHPLSWVLLPAFLAGELLRERRVTRRFVLAVLGAVLVYGAIASLIDTSAGAQVAPYEGGVAGGYGSLLEETLTDELTRLPSWTLDGLYDYGRAGFVLWNAPLPGWRSLKYVLLVLSLIPVLWAWGRRLRRHGSAEAFCALYFAALLPWSFSDTRYLIPLVPFFYAYFWSGLYQIQAAAGHRGRYATVLALVAVGVVYASRYGLREPARSGEAVQSAVYDRVRSTTPPAAVVVTNTDPRHLPFRTGRAASLGPVSFDEWTRYAARIGADYALVEHWPGVAQDVLPYPVVFRQDGWTMYRITAPPREEP